jgi:hypothetical protein
MGYFEGTTSNLYVKGDFNWIKDSINTPSLLKYLPIAWLANGSAQTMFASWPMCYTGSSSYINLPSDFALADDGVQLGPRVRVQLYNIIDPTTQTPSFDLTNSSFTNWSFAATSPPNTIRSYRAFFF